MMTISEMAAEIASRRAKAEQARAALNELPDQIAAAAPSYLRGFFCRAVK